MGKLKYFCEIVGKPVEYFEGIKDYYSTGAVGREKLVEEVTYEGRTGRANLQLKATDIIIAKMQNTDKTTLIDEESAENIYSTGFMALNSSKMDNKFLYYLLQSPEFEFEKDMNSYGTTQVAISEQNFKTIDIEFIKDRKEQHQIANFLDQKVGQVDKTIESLESQVEKLTEYKKSLITEVVTKGLDRDVEMKDSGVEWIGEIPKDWEIPRVKDLFHVSRGRVISALDLEDDGEFPVYSSQTLNEGCLGYIKTFDYDRSQITWTTDGVNAGTVFIRGGKHNCTNVCGIMFPKNNNNNLKYMKYVLEFVALHHKREDINGYKIMSNEMAEIKITLMERRLQDKIVSYLDLKCGEVDTIIQQKQSQIEIMNKYKKSLIYEYVTGKKRVKGSEQLGS